MASVRARLVGEVATTSAGQTGVWVGFTPLDTRGVPDGYTVVYRFTATISKPGGGTRTVTLTPPSQAAIDSYGQVGNTPAAGLFQAVDLHRGEKVEALHGAISVVPDEGGAPLFTSRDLPVAEYTVHPSR
jgi:hypothetical protein